VLIVSGAAFLLAPDHVLCTGPAIALLCAYFIMRKIKSGSAITSHPAGLPSALLVFAIVPASALLSPFPAEKSLAAAGMALWSAALFALISGSGTGADMRRRDVAPLAAGAAVALLSAAALFFMQRVYKVEGVGRIADGIPRFLPGGGSPENGIPVGHIAGLAVIFAPVALAAVWDFLRDIKQDSSISKRKIISGALAAASFLLLCAVTLLTQSRTGVLALLAGTGVALCLLGAAGRALFGIGLASLLAVSLSIGLERISDAFLYAGKLSGLSAFTLFSGRTEVWAGALFAIRDFPWTGLGPASFGHGRLLLYPLDLGMPATVTHAHNQLLQTALDAGIPGLLCSIWLLCAAFKPVLKGAAGARPDCSRAGLLGSLAALLLFGLAEALPLGGAPGIIIWLVPALAIRHSLLADVSLRAPRSPRRRKTRVLVLSVLFVAVLSIDLLLPLFSTMGGSASRNLYNLELARSALRRSPPPPAPENSAGAERSGWLLGIAYSVHGDTARRDSAWSIILNADPAYVTLARIAAPTTQFLAETAHSAHPRDARACFWLAELVSPSDTERAVSLYRTGLSDDPSNGLAWRKLGDLLMPGDPRAALDAYLQSCLNGDPGANGCLLAGRAAERLGDFHSAIRYYRMSRYGRARERADELESRLNKNP